MAATNKISVIIPTYKRVDLLRRCLQSLKEQTFSDFEVIIVDNDGFDSAVEVSIKQTDDHRFKYACQPVAGVSAARNMGIELAANDLILFIDDDDEVDSSILQKLVDFMSKQEQANVAFTWCGVLKLIEKTKGMLPEKKEFIVSQSDLNDMSFILKIGTGCGLCVRKKDLLDVDCFNETYTLSEDRDLVIKLIKAGKKYRPINKLLYMRHYHSGDRLSESLHELDEAEHDSKLYSDHEDFIKLYPELLLRLLDLRAMHYFCGGEVDRAIEIARKAWKIRPFRIKGIRRLVTYLFTKKYRK